MLVRFAGLSTTHEPIGTDGYYYVVQAETWLATGHLHAPDPSWVLRFIALVVRSCGDPVIGVKVAAAMLGAACVPAAAFCAWAKRASAPVSASWAVASPVIAHLAGEHPKNLGAAAPLLVFVGALLAFDREGRRRWLAVAAAAALAAATAHKSAAVLVALIAFEAIARRFRWAWLAPVLLGTLLAVGRPDDLERVTSELTFFPWPPHPLRYFGARAVPFVEAVELCVPWLALVVAWRARLPLMLACLAVVAPIWRPDTVDLGFRLALFAPVLLVPATLPRLPRFVAVACVVAAWPVELAVRADDVTPPYAEYRALIAQIPRPELLIAHSGFNFLYHHETQHEAMAWAPEPELDPTRIGRLVHGVEPKEWLAYLPPDVPAPLPLAGGYSYWREDHFRRFLESIEGVDNDDLKLRLAGDLNPRRVRPAFLLRRH